MRSKRKIMKQDSYAERIAKLIPYEIIALYWAIAGVLDGQLNGKEKLVLTAVGVFCFFATPLYLIFVQRVQSSATVSATMQIIISTISWPVYLYAMKGPFELWGLYNGQIAAGALIFWVTLSGWLSKK